MSERARPNDTIIRAKIIGAGSAGNHLAHACCNLGWQVSLYDRNHSALERTRDEIYPDRYGDWNENIRLCFAGNPRDEKFDIVIIATQARSHLELAIAELKAHPPRVLLIEKPLARPDDPDLQNFLQLAGSLADKTEILVGYNLNLTANSRIVCDMLRGRRIGRLHTIDVRFREDIAYFQKAHPWLNIYERDTCSTMDGGGACAEQSHALALWQLFAATARMGNITTVRARQSFQTVDERSFDSETLISLETDGGLLGSIHTDLKTSPAEKHARLIGDDGKIDWWLSYRDGIDVVELATEDSRERLEIKKSRPDDFRHQMEYIDRYLRDPSAANRAKLAPLSLRQGLDTYRLILAAHLSGSENRPVEFDDQNAADIFG